MSRPGNDGLVVSADKTLTLEPFIDSEYPLFGFACCWAAINRAVADVLQTPRTTKGDYSMREKALGWICGEHLDCGKIPTRRHGLLTFEDACSTCGVDPARVKKLMRWFLSEFKEVNKKKKLFQDAAYSTIPNLEAIYKIVKRDLPRPLSLGEDPEKAVPLSIARIGIDRRARMDRDYGYPTRLEVGVGENKAYNKCLNKHHYNWRNLW